MSEQEKARNIKHIFMRTAVKIILIIILTVSLLLNLFTLVMPVVKYYGTSMSPTLEDGQILIVSKLSEIESGDIIAFYYNNKVLVRRVVATGNEQLSIVPSAKLLTNIDHLKVGDRFYLHVLNEVLEYQIDDVSVVEPDEVSRLNVISGKDCVTLVTCTPYGVNSHRLLVRGVRVDGTDLSANKDGVTNELLNIDMKYLLTFSLIGLCMIFVAVVKLRSIYKKRKAYDEKGGEVKNEEDS